MDSTPQRSSSLTRGAPLEAAFFSRAPDLVAQELLGAVLVSCVDGIEAGGRIVEVEAYLGRDDAGSHAATRGITKRNAAMYGAPGSVYVYFTYGSHHMLNLVCEPEGTAGAVLIRAIEPLIGIDAMSARRRSLPLSDLCNGPGKLAAALGVDLTDNRTMLGHGRLSVFPGTHVSPDRIAASGRIGLSSGDELQLRWFVIGSSFISRGRPGPVGRRARQSTKESAE